jgi:hypothetical protein
VLRREIVTRTSAMPRTRGLSLRLSYDRQRVENVADHKDSPYAGLNEIQDQREGGRYELRIRELSAVFGGNWASLRMWRTVSNGSE